MVYWTLQHIEYACIDDQVMSSGPWQNKALASCGSARHSRAPHPTLPLPCAISRAKKVMQMHAAAMAAPMQVVYRDTPGSRTKSRWQIAPKIIEAAKPQAPLTMPALSSDVTCPGNAACWKSGTYAPIIFCAMRRIPVRSRHTSPREG